MVQLKALNTREKKEIFQMLEEQFGIKEHVDYIFFENNKEKIFIISSAFAQLNQAQVRINNIGMYFATREKDGLRLSIEGAQLVNAKKNSIELTKEQAHQWMKGEDIPMEGNLGYVIVRYKKDTFGCGSLKNNILRNMVPKERRLHSITE